MSLNTDPEVAKRLVFEFTHEELLTPTLMYVWNAETAELERLAEEIIGRMSPEFVERYIKQDIAYYQDQLFLLSDTSLETAFRVLCQRADHNKLRDLDAYIQLILAGPCKTDECREDCNEYYRSANNAD